MQRPQLVDDLFAARQPTSMAKEATIFRTRSEVEAMLEKEKENAFILFVYLDLKRPYLVELAAKPYSMVYVVPKF